MSISDLPTVNACLNTLSAALLLGGWLAIRKGNREAHAKWMIAALISSAAFLTCYLIYHSQVLHVKFQGEGLMRIVYFAILIPHVILAALNVPFIIALVWFAWKKNFERHRKLAKWVWPVWMFVSVSGVMVYIMLYRM
jgi:uncharacterized membrane protein YozB (DUF420 family)